MSIRKFLFPPAMWRRCISPLPWDPTLRWVFDGLEPPRRPERKKLAGSSAVGWLQSPNKSAPLRPPLSPSVARIRCHYLAPLPFVPARSVSYRSSGLLWCSSEYSQPSREIRGDAVITILQGIAGFTAGLSYRSQYWRAVPADPVSAKAPGPLSHECCLKVSCCSQ